MNFSRIIPTAKVFLLFGFLAVFVNSCMKDKPEPPKSMDQIKAEEGIPVIISEIKKSGFTKDLTYFANLIPIKETIEVSKVSDKIINLYAKMGDFVKEGQVIMEFPSSNPALQYDQAKAALDNAELTAKRMKELLDAGEISQQMFDNANTQYVVSKRNFEQLNQLLKVKAPASGTIINLPYRAGDVPKMGEVLFSVATTNKMIAKVNVSDREIGFIKKGMEADVVWNGTSYKGIVSVIGLEMSPLTRSFPVEIEINNAKNELRSGITVEVRIVIADNSNVIAIDRKFILDENGKKYIFVENDGTAKKKEITIGQQSGVLVEVTSGLSEGENLIACCTTFLEDGSKIKIDTKGNK